MKGETKTSVEGLWEEVIGGLEEAAHFNNAIADLEADFLPDHEADITEDDPPLYSVAKFIEDVLLKDYQAQILSMISGFEAGSDLELVNLFNPFELGRLPSTCDYSFTNVVKDVEE